MRLTFPSPEFDDAVAAVCHGAMSEAEARALNELLRRDPNARDEYLLRVEIHSRLASEPDAFSTETQATAGCRLPESCIGWGDRRSTFTPTPAAPPTRRRVMQVLAFAACLALVLAGVWRLWFRQPDARSGVTSKAVAMLTRTVDAQWATRAGLPRAGSALEPGTLRLESGLAQVVFYSGARVVIEGPAELKLVSPNEAVCLAGRLLAEVPQPARGFRLKTDCLDVVDLGTAFGVDVSPDRTEVHVFKGEVELLPAKSVKQSLNEGQAARALARATPQLMAADTAAFAALFDFQQRSLASEAYRYEQWQFANAWLNQDPSLLVHLDFQDFISSDWPLRNTAERNRTVPEATIVGCQSGPGRWREKQALEFQTVSDRVRLAVPGGFQSLTLSAWVRVQGLDREFNSLFMCDGFEPGTIHWLIRNDGVLGLTVFGPTVGNYQILASPPALTPDRLGMWTHLAVVIDGKAKQVVHYVNGAPIARLDLRLGPPYRLGPVELGNWNARSGPNAPPSLVRNLSGSLDEFELFGRALTEGEVRERYAQGKPEM